jgi:magnesium chelatase family protein
LKWFPVPFKKLSEQESSETSETVRERVLAARKIQEERFREHKGVYANAQMNSKLIRQYVVLDESSNELIKNAMDRLGLSARAYDRILKVSRTIADLEGEPNVLPHHLSEAIHYRSLDRENWGG